MWYPFGISVQCHCDDQGCIGGSCQLWPLFCSGNKGPKPAAPWPVRAFNPTRRDTQKYSPFSGLIEWVEFSSVVEGAEPQWPGPAAERARVGTVKLGHLMAAAPGQYGPVDLWPSWQSVQWPNGDLDLGGRGERLICCPRRDCPAEMLRNRGRI